MTQQQQVEAVRKFQQWLMDQRIGSFGPQTGMVLAKIQVELEERLATIEDPEVKEQAVAYEAALREVVVAGALHMGAAIESLGALVEAMQGAEDRG